MSKILHNKYFSIIYTIIRDIFFFVVVLYLAFILMQRISGNNNIFGYRLFTVATGSMSGVYEINDVIAVKNYDVLKLKVGDDIAYRGSRGGLEELRHIPCRKHAQKPFALLAVGGNEHDPHTLRLLSRLLEELYHICCEHFLRHECERFRTVLV